MDKRPIGIFDSGVGGLTVLAALRACLPHESFIYIADLARMPYGNKSPEVLHHYAHELVTWLQFMGVKMVVMACNTTAANVSTAWMSSFDVPLVDPIHPTATAIAPHYNHVGLLATLATVQSGAYQRHLQAQNPDLHVTAVACPALVPLIEGDKLHAAEAATAIETYLHQLLTPEPPKPLEALIYGCTHYPHLAFLLAPLLPPQVRLINPADHLAHTVHTFLCEHELEAPKIRTSDPLNTVRFYTTAPSETFNMFASRLMRTSITPTLVDLHKDIGNL